MSSLGLAPALAVNWLRRITSLQGQRLTLKQHREILILAGWVALPAGCVEYDTGNRHAAGTTRQAALSLGVEADHGEIVARAHEMRAWINLTTGDYHGVVAAARNGTQVTAHHSVAVQLFAQEAKAWAPDGRPPPDRGRPRQGQDPARHAALPGEPRPPLRGRPDEVRLRSRPAGLWRRLAGAKGNDRGR
jgi:hypothetical protein